MVGRPDQTPEHQKQQEHRPAWPRVPEFFRIQVSDEESTAARLTFRKCSIQAYD